jgi:hypothetical protein
MFIFSAYFLNHHAQLVERRLQFKEGQRTEVGMMLGNLIFLAGFLITDLDHRFERTGDMGGSAILTENSGAGVRIGWLPDVREGDKRELLCLAHDSGKTRPESDLGRTVQTGSCSYAFQRADYARANSWSPGIHRDAAIFHADHSRSRGTFPE